MWRSVPLEQDRQYKLTLIWNGRPRAEKLRVLAGRFSTTVRLWSINSPMESYFWPGPRQLRFSAQASTSPTCAAILRPEIAQGAPASQRKISACSRSWLDSRRKLAQPSDATAKAPLSSDAPARLASDATPLANPA